MLVQFQNRSNTAHTDIRGDLETLSNTVSGQTTAISTHENSLEVLDTTTKNIIKGDYLGTDGMFLDFTKAEQGVKIDVTPMAAVTDATSAEDVVTQFNALLAEMRTMGLISEA